MFKQIAEFYGLYLEKDFGAEGNAKWVLGDYQGNSVMLDVHAVSSKEFRAMCEKMNPFA